MNDDDDDSSTNDCKLTFKEANRCDDPKQSHDDA
jgi:hypothetical protein